MGGMSTVRGYDTGIFSGDQGWVVNQELQCSLYTGAFEEPATWGVLLADLVRTITSALKENDGKDPQETLDEILTAFQEELANDP